MYHDYPCSLSHHYFPLGLLFTCPNLGKYISGAILYEETLFQSHANGTPFVDCLKSIGVFPGIKVDTGLQPLPGGHPVETWFDFVLRCLNNQVAQISLLTIYRPCFRNQSTNRFSYFPIDC